MGNLQVVTVDDNKKWDNIVKSFKNYDIYYLSAYAKAFQIHGDGEPKLFHYENDRIRGINVVMQRDIAQDKYFVGKLPEGVFYDIATPYGYGGFLIEGDTNAESLKQMDAEYVAYCKHEGIISEFVRFHPVLNNSEGLRNIYNISQLGKTISMDMDSREQIWVNLTSKNRNMIRKAQKAELKIFWGRAPDLYQEFIQLYNATMNNVKADNYYYFGEDFYNSILYNLRYNALLFYATYRDKIIAMSIILLANQQMHYHLSASDIDYQHMAPTNLLLYEVACWGSENGYKKFHLGGGLGSGEDSLYKFKSAFNRSSNNIFSIGKKIFEQEKYDELVKMRRDEGGIEAASSFFPTYRAVFGG